MLQFIASNWQIKQNSFHCHDIVPSFLEHLYLVRTEKAATAQPGCTAAPQIKYKDKKESNFPDWLKCFFIKYYLLILIQSQWISKLFSK